MLKQYFWAYFLAFPPISSQVRSRQLVDVIHNEFSKYKFKIDDITASKCAHNLNRAVMSMTLTEQICRVFLLISLEYFRCYILSYFAGGTLETQVMQKAQGCLKNHMLSLEHLWLDKVDRVTVRFQF